MSDRSQQIHDSVKSYYSMLTNEKGGRLASSVCCCACDSVPEAIRETVAMLPDEIVAKYYGCGSPIPDMIEGCTVLDLGCGTGRDAYVVSKLVGERGSVIGIDMNEDQLAVARRYQDEMAQKLGLANVEFRLGYIEDLAAAGIADASVDVVISNCVINLSPDKAAVFSEIRRVLRDGGVLFFSDVFADRPVPPEVSANPLLLGECLGGSMSYDEFRDLMRCNGWSDYEVVSSCATPVENPAIEALVGDVRYTSDTVRAVKVASSVTAYGWSFEPIEPRAIAVPYPQAGGCC